MMSVTWQWRSDADPWNWEKTDAQWTSYSTDESNLIEEAYLSSTAKKVLSIHDYHCIDVVNCIQFVQRYPDIQRPIRRLYNEQNQSQARLHRFYEVDDTFFQPFVMNQKARSLLIDEWWEKFVQRKPTCSEEDIVDAAMVGIRQEGDQLDKLEQASKICEQLQSVRNNPDFDAIKKRAVRLYTENTFLYELVNKALRQVDRRRYRDTLGPYCYLLRKYLCQRSHQLKFYRGTVYRGAWLHPRMIGRFKKEMTKTDKETMLMWLGFTSTTKNRTAAEMFEGNTLFIIDLGENPYFTSRGVDISGISMMPDEEEILLPPGFEFQCTDVETIEKEGETQPFRHFKVHLVARQI